MKGNNMDNKIVHAAPVPPFVTFVASAVPMVFDNSMSYYEALCALWKWLQDDVINVINNNANVTNNYIDLTNEYIEKFNELKTYVDTYFENLDVQEEINNKLDAMVEDGTLQEIITTYIQANVAWTFDTVADMKLATNLVAGSFAQTLGFHSIGDGGSALYKISDTGTANEKDVIAVDDLYAELVKTTTITPEMYGAYGDGIHDDTASIQECFSKNNNIVMTKTYLITSQLTFNGFIDGKKTGVLKTNPESRITGAFIYSTAGLKIKGLKFDCSSTVAFTLDDKFNNYNVGVITNGDVEIKDCEFRNLYEKFIRITGNAVNHVNICDSLFSSDNKTNVYMSVCVEMSNIVNDDCIINIHNNQFKGYEFEYVGTYDNDYNINAAGLSLNNLNVGSLDITENLFDHLGRYGSVSGNAGLSRLCVIDCYFNVKPLHLINNQITNCHWTALRLHGTPDAVIDGNYITVARACSETLITISDSYNTTGEAPVGCDNIVISNNTIINKDKIFEQGIFVNSYSGASLVTPDGFYGSVNNLVMFNNDINFCCKHLFVFDYSLKTFTCEYNRIEGDFSGVSGIGTHDMFSIDTRTVMKNAGYGKSFANTIMLFKYNTLKLDGSNIYLRTTDSDLVSIYADLTCDCDKNVMQNTAVGYVTYATAGQNFNLIDNVIKGNVGGVNTANKTYDNIVFYQSGSAGIYNATVSQNNHEYTN